IGQRVTRWGRERKMHRIDHALLAGHLSIAAAVEKATEPTEANAEGNGRGDDVNELQRAMALFAEGQPVTESLGRNAAENRTIKHDAAVPDARELLEKVPESGGHLLTKKIGDSGSQ